MRKRAVAAAIAVALAVGALGGSQVGGEKDVSLPDHCDPNPRDCVVDEFAGHRDEMPEVLQLLKGSTNGYLSSSELSPITGGVVSSAFPGTGQMAHDAAAAWNAAAVRAHVATGTWLQTNGSDSAYRPYSRQVYWRNYWCSRGACQNAAIPGTSNHGLGRAADVTPTTGSLLERYGAPYGWRRACSDAPWESWHWKWCGGWSGRDPGPYGRGSPGAGPVDRTPTLRKGDKSKAVRRAQRLLREWNIGVARPRVDGSFGPRTKRAVEQFQRIRGLKPDGVIGERTWRRLRKSDHFLDDERLRLNRITLYRTRGVTGWERKRITASRHWCARRANAIARTARTAGWKGQHRRERYDRLREVA